MATSYRKLSLPLCEDTFSFLDLVSSCVHPLYVEIRQGKEIALQNRLAIQTYIIWYGILHPHDALNFYIHEEDVSLFCNFTKECVQI